MQNNKITVTEQRKNYILPEIHIIDVITLLTLIGCIILLVTDKNVPEYLVGIVTLGVGIRVNPQSSKIDNLP